LLDINNSSPAESVDEEAAANSRIAEPEVAKQSKSLSPGEALLNRISQDTDFPTFSNHIIEINRQISKPSKFSSATDLSNAILKDYALTGKLLKLVNSAYYSVTAGKITTITRAVVLLGYETVRSAATNLLLFDLMTSKSSANELKEAFVKAFWSGLIAKDASEIISKKGHEEAFICAMLHDLGKHVVLLYLPDEWDEISNLIATEGFSEMRASKAVLGVSFENLGIAVAKRWRFPPKIVNSMERLSGGSLQKDKGKVDTLQALSNFSNDLCQIIHTTKGEGRKKALSALSSQYKNHVPIAPKQITKMIDASLKKVEKHADLLTIDLKKSTFLQRLTVGAKEQSPDRSNPRVDLKLNPEFEKMLVDGQSNPDASNMLSNDGKPANPDEVILSGVQDMSAAMVGDFKINDIALMALETMYRGLAFNRVVFFMMRKDRKMLEARFGFGAGIEYIVDRLSFDTKGGTDIFNIAMAKGKDLIIEDAAKQPVNELIPQWFRQQINTPAFIFLPIVYNTTCLGAFFADREEAGPPLKAGEYKFITMLRNQLILAIKYRT